MSIIYDALKKIQQGPSPKADETPYEKPAEIEILPRGGQQTAHQKPLIQNKIKSTLILCGAIAITAASVLHIYRQFQTDIPKVKSFAKAHEDLVALAKLAVQAPKPLNPPSPTKLPAISDTLKTNAPQTLNIHGVMSNGSNNLVLIDDQVYQEGDDVDGVKIVKISLDSITVISNGKEETIRVK